MSATIFELSAPTIASAAVASDLNKTLLATYGIKESITSEGLLDLDVFTVFIKVDRTLAFGFARSLWTVGRSTLAV